ncbi:MAG: nucleotidyltransferase domain-containing protein [Candidatus Omnitrophota bacterium]
MMQLTKSEQRILQYLSSHSEEALYESQIASGAHISAGSTNQTLKGLLKKELLCLSKKGRMNFYSLNYDHPLVRQYKVMQTITEINGLINRLRPLTSRVILFGSCAEGIDSPNSDIDLVIVSSRADEARRLIKRQKTKREIQPLIFDTGEFIALERKDRPLYERIQKGIILWKQK